VNVRTLLRRSTVAAAALAVTATMAGCGGDDAAQPTGSLAIVVGARSNMPTPVLEGKAAEARDAAVAQQSYLSVWVADGAPTQAAKGRLVVDAHNDVARDQQREANRQRVDQVIADARASAPESDLLQALTDAERSIDSQPAEHTIVVLDSGLSTTGALDFTQPGMLDADPQELATSLKAAGELPDLDGVRVVFQGLGDTAAPQPKLGNARRQHLIDIWTAVVAAAGAGDVEIEQAPLQGDSAEGLPTVSPVAIDAGVSCGAGTVTLTGGDVAFQADSAVFLDPDAARTTLQPIAEQMQAARLTATLTGTTANVGDKAGQSRLSQQRAQAVADLLVDLGVPRASLVVIGLGSDFPGYVQDHDAAGNLLPGPAAANRKVEIRMTGGGAVTCADPAV
jgi:outer membrane protein OmpA-like peptidoglycan-associated protein